MSGAPASRRLGSWIDSYLEYTEIIPSPPLFRKWVAISFLAAAMERRLWVKTMGSSLFPNLYTVLVGPPGIGKGQAIHPGESMMREVPGIHIGPSDLTSASLIDALNESVRHVMLLHTNPPSVEFNSLIVISRELGVLIPAWEASFMNSLTDIYDGFTVDQKRRGKDLRIKIASPQINLLGACTPGYLNEVMPAGAWDQGFISRTILVYSGDRSARDPFGEVLLGERLRSDLLHDLKTIALDFGQMAFTTPAAVAIKAWVKSGCIPEPEHQKLRYYNSRRIAHLLKLCMISSISHSSDRIITIENYAEALNWLIEVESYMPDIFKSMTSGGDSAAMNEAWTHAWNLFSKEKKPIAEHRIVHFLRERVPAHNVMRVLDIMVRSNMLEASMSEKGLPNYKPTAKADRAQG